jgi:hypothetical protein
MVVPIDKQTESSRTVELYQKLRRKCVHNLPVHSLVTGIYCCKLYGFMHPTIGTSMSDRLRYGPLDCIMKPGLQTTMLDIKDNNG